MGRYIGRGPALLLVLTVFALPLVATAQQPAQVRRIAVLGYGPWPAAEAFRHALRERGWREGGNLVIEWRQTKEGSDNFDTLVAEMVQLPVEVLVVPNATTAQIARQATTTIPIVVVGGGALLRTRLVTSLARPGGNVTGIATLGPERNAKTLELLKEALPEVTRVAVLRGLAPQPIELLAMEEVAQSLGVELQLFFAHESSEFDSAFAAMASAQAQALFVFGDPSFSPISNGSSTWRPSTICPRSPRVVNMSRWGVS